jgi:hypothetical protein
VQVESGTAVANDMAFVIQRIGADGSSIITHAAFKDVIHKIPS